MSRSARRGQVAVITTLVIVFILALAGLAIDVGEFWTTRRQMQTAADAAALAAVNDLAVSNITDLTTDAHNAAAKNGFANGGTTSFSHSAVTVGVQHPPTSGTYSGNDGAVTVTITQNQPTQFLRFVGFSTVPVRVSATGLTSTGGSCIYTLDPSGSGSFSISGTASITSACGLYVDSSSSSAAIASGGGTVTAPRLGVVGGTSINGGGTVPVTTSIPAFGDPLSWITGPAAGSCSSSKGTTISGTIPDIENSTEYCGGLTIGSHAIVTFNPGLYVINGGGFKIGAGATVTGNGVTFYLTGQNGGGSSNKVYGGVTMDGSATVTLSAPNLCGTGTGPTTNSVGSSINGILFFQDRSITATGSNGSTITGAAGSSFNGALYFPTTSLTYAGNSASNGYTYIVAYDLTVTGNATIGNNYSCLNGQSSIIQNASLVM